jgi:RNA polymerase sigma factor (sigma-70 family)
MPQGSSLATPTVSHSQQRKRLDPAQEAELIVLYQARGADFERAAQALVESQRPLIDGMAKQYYEFNMHYVPLDDLISAGLEGLHSAMVRFDTSRGWRLSTYAYPLIREGMHQEIRRLRWAMGIPERMYKKLVHLSQVRVKLSQEHQREPTRDELATALGCSSADLDILIVWSGRDALSLDRPQGANGDTSLLALIISEDYYIWESDWESADPVNYSISTNRRKEVRRLLEGLDTRSALALHMRFGIPKDGRSPDRMHTFGEIGSELGIGAERARQIVNTALSALRHPRAILSVRNFITE